MSSSSDSDSDSDGSFNFANTNAIKFISKKKPPPQPPDSDDSEDSDSDSDSDGSSGSSAKPMSKSTTKKSSTSKSSTSKSSSSKSKPNKTHTHSTRQHASTDHNTTNTNTNTKDKDIDLVEIDDSFDFDTFDANADHSTPKKKTAALSKAKTIREKLAAAQTNTLIEIDSDSDSPPTPSNTSSASKVVSVSSSSAPQKFITINLRLNGSSIVPLKINYDLRISDEITRYIAASKSGTNIKIVFDGDVILAETCSTLDVEDDDQFDVTFTSTHVPRLKIKTTLPSGISKAWSLKSNDTFSVLYSACEKHYGSSVSLKFDGSIIPPTSTPSSLSMEDSDVIDCLLLSSLPKKPPLISKPVIIKCNRNYNPRQSRKYRLSPSDPLSKIIKPHQEHYKSARGKGVRFYYKGEEVTGRIVGEIGYREEDVLEVVDNGKRK
ncbi:hypothetical protein TrVE_jg8484 [Triparma verrucosa]|uniref:Rad60/SUMO-like domain-containing protein n=2 Tax=Triparma verrucosa TaxID=1606542 RepID=A0A9W7EWS4_9STRA|nr:hypothetical protein TrVE_jg8484 [Triparma verrucosa]